MRKIIVSGFLAKDATRRISKQNREYVTFEMANSEYNDEKGQDGRPITRWFRVTCFNPNQLSFVSNIKKGSNVIVTGSFSDSVYQNHSGGWNVGREIIADSVDYNGTRQPDGQNNGQTQNPTVGNMHTALPQGAATPAMPTVSPIPQGAAVPQSSASPKPQTTTVNGNIPIPPTNVSAEDAVDDLPF